MILSPTGIFIVAYALMDHAGSNAASRVLKGLEQRESNKDCGKYFAPSISKTPRELEANAQAVEESCRRMARFQKTHDQRWLKPAARVWWNLNNPDPSLPVLKLPPLSQTETDELGL